MEYIMIHPQYGTEMTVGPQKVKRLQALGWKLKAEPTAEVLKFEQTKAAEFIAAKKQASPLPFPTDISQVVPVQKIEPKQEPEPQQESQQEIQQETQPEPEPVKQQMRPVNKGGRPTKKR